MASETFIDASGFFASLNPHDKHFEDADRWFREIGGTSSIITTDYILDETVTLLQSRGQRHLATPWLDRVLTAKNCYIV